MMPSCQYSIVLDRPNAIVIRDIGHNLGFMSITNDVDSLVACLAHQLRDRHLYYYDSDGSLDEILHSNGRFTGFRFLDTQAREAIGRM